jgi:plastocyanin
MNDKKALIWIIVLALVIGGVYYFTRGNEKSPNGNSSPSDSYSAANNSYTSPNNAPAPRNESLQNPAAVSANTVEIDSDGFSPNEIKIKAGDTVTWVNKDTVPHWPATAAHPTHTVYPGSDITKCGTAAQASIFDACKGLAQGESYSFKFDQKGDWKYHDHLKPMAPFFGSVTVE